jgi:molecular chaperone Hsp33
MSQMLQDDLSTVEVQSYYVRKRNALLVRGRFGPLFMDYYLHLMQHSIKQEPAHDERLKSALAALALYLGSRPQDETTAWTVNIQKPLLNLFVTGGSRPGRVTGRVFVEDVKDSGSGLFISQVTRPNHQARQSMVETQGSDVLEMVEHFYHQSEQRLTRFFPGADEELIMLTAEPDCDEDWLMSLAPDEVPTIGEREHLTLLETRGYSFECGCSVDRLYPLLGRLSEDDLSHVFADGVAIITCPRCAAVYRTQLGHFEEWRAAQ